MSTRPLSDGVLLRHVSPRRFHDELELVWSQQRIVSQLEPESRGLLQLLDKIALLLQHVHRDIRMQLHDERIALALDGDPPDRALDTTHDGLRGEYPPGSMTHGARLGHILQMALTHALPRHLDQAKIAHGERLRSGAIEIGRAHV